MGNRKTCYSYYYRNLNAQTRDSYWSTINDGFLILDFPTDSLLEAIIRGDE